MQTYFSNKHAVGDSKIMLIKNDKTILDNEQVSEEFNNYFSPIVDSLDLYEFPLELRREYAGEIDNIVSKFKTHPTIIFIIFWGFLMFYEFFLSPQVKRCAIITYKHDIYEFPHELPNKKRFKILRN